MNEKTKNFFKKCKKPIIVIGIGLAVGVVGYFVSKRFIKVEDVKKLPITINPKWVNNIEEAISMFKDLDTKTEHAAICSNLGLEGIKWYGVYDETPVLN